MPSDLLSRGCLRTRHTHARFTGSSRSAHSKLGEPEDALTSCKAGLQLIPDHADHLALAALVLTELGSLDAAESHWRRILNLPPRTRFVMMSTTGLCGHEARRNLANLLERRCRYIDAYKIWSHVLSECPRDREATAARARLAHRAVMGWVSEAKRRVRKVLVALWPNQSAPGHEFPRHPYVKWCRASFRSQPRLPVPRSKVTCSVASPNAV